MVSLIVVLKNEVYPLKNLSKRTTGLLNKEQFLLGILVFGVFGMVFCSLVIGEVFEPHLVLACCFPFVCYILFFSSIVLSLFVFLFFPMFSPSVLLGLYHA
jgi:hypothetical protein